VIRRCVYQLHRQLSSTWIGKHTCPYQSSATACESRRSPWQARFCPPFPHFRISPFPISYFLVPGFSTTLCSRYACAYAFLLRCRAEEVRQEVEPDVIYRQAICIPYVFELCTGLLLDPDHAPRATSLPTEAVSYVRHCFLRVLAKPGFCQ